MYISSFDMSLNSTVIYPTVYLTCPLKSATDISNLTSKTELLLRPPHQMQTKQNNPGFLMWVYSKVDHQAAQSEALESPVAPTTHSQSAEKCICHYSTFKTQLESKQGIGGKLAQTTTNSEKNNKGVKAFRRLVNKREKTQNTNTRNELVQFLQTLKWGRYLAWFYGKLLENQIKWTNSLKSTSY